MGKKPGPAQEITPDYVVVGETHAGKTSLIGALLADPGRSIGGWLTQALALSDDAKRLVQDYRKVLEGELLPPTSGDFYRYDFTIDRLQTSPQVMDIVRGIFSKRLSSSKFQMIDGPGGWIVPTSGLELGVEERQKAKAFQASALGAKGAMLCIPTTAGEEKYEGHGRGVSDWLRQLRQSANQKRQGRYRLLIALTKYEREFYEQKNAALWEAKTPQNFSAIARKRLEPLKSDLVFLDHNPYVSVHFSPLSAYGFIKGSGQANYHPDTKLPLMTELSREDGVSTKVVERSWEPFNVVESFLFLALGIKSDLIFTLQEVFEDE